MALLVKGGNMAGHYGLYFLVASNHIVSANDFECPDDDGAMSMEFANGHNLEPWSGARLVARISGKNARTRAA